MELDPKETSNIEQAKRNAAEIANEVLVVLKEIAQG
jgi:hypothetical protein